MSRMNASENFPGGHRVEFETVKGAMKTRGADGSYLIRITLPLTKTLIKCHELLLLTTQAGSSCLWTLKIYSMRVTL